MEEDKLKEILNKRVRDLQRDINFIYALGETPRVEEEEKRIIEEVLNLIERLQNKNEKLISDNLEYQRIQDIFDKRTYRKKYLEERRKEQPNLLYPDADEIYQRYYELKQENEELKRLHINIQGMRNGKELLNKYITDSIPKQVIRGKINTLEMEEHYGYIDNKKAISVLKELLEGE